MRRTGIRRGAGWVVLFCGLAATASEADIVGVKVIIENRAPSAGTWLTPFWVGFHNGTFDTHDVGAAASMELERLAEDGNTGPLMDLFASSGAGEAQGTLVSSTGIPPLGPGESAEMTFAVDGDLLSSRYFSYASMVIPSNDAFVANEDPMTHQVFDGSGGFLGGFIQIMGSAVKDAGTEVNDEIPAHTAFFGQMMPNTGVAENGVVHAHPGFLPPGSGGILDDPMFANANFSQPGYEVARITLVRNDTIVPAGNVSGVWDRSGSPYIVEGDLTVPAGQTLTIEPGVVVFFTSWYGITVNGTILAEGTAEAPILFTATPPGPGEPGRKNIRVVDSTGSVFAHCRFEHGQTRGIEPWNRGAAIACERAELVIRNCEFFNHNAPRGGTIYVADSMNVLIADSRISDSSAGDGGAIFCTNSDVEITGCRIEDNVASAVSTFSPVNVDGGGIALFESTGTLSHNLIINNLAAGQGNVGSSVDGGGVSLVVSDVTLINNTIYGNEARLFSTPQDGAGIDVASDFVTHTVTFVNNIIAGNIGSGIFLGENVAADVRYNDFWLNSGGDFTGPGIPPGLGVITRQNANGDPADAFFNILLDPQFVTPGANFHLQETSPAIDAGDPNTPRDPDGTIADLGALYFPQQVPGDMNCDGFIDNEDIDPFVLAVTQGQSAYQSAWPNCNFLNGDINGDGFVDNEDIDPFVALLTGP